MRGPGGHGIKASNNEIMERGFFLDQGLRDVVKACFYIRVRKHFSSHFVLPEDN